MGTVGEQDLFGPEEERDGGRARPPGAEPHESAPLAARMRPRSLAEFRGQEHLLGGGKAIRGMIESGRPSSMILWGPPGSGKTTLARIVAAETGVTFVPFSAVTVGVARVREIIAEAGTRLRVSGRQTVLFCDEIHRFNKGQQDAFLPHVEAGTVVLIGATTENPSFEVVRPLLSRAPVLVLHALAPEDVRAVLDAALQDRERGLGGHGLDVHDDAMEFMALASDGDARRALNVLEAAAGLVGAGGVIHQDVAREALQHRFALYDKAGEEHYNLISALHKAVRGSDADAALYWLARMIEGGEEALYVARRLVRMAAEDIGMADPHALAVAVAAKDAFHFLGPPEGELALAEAVVYLATAPKSNRVYRAWGEALAQARATPSEPVPLHIRNAPTQLMRELGYGEGYRYDPEEPGGMSPQTYLPDRLRGLRLYEPGPEGHEADIARRLALIQERRSAAAAREARRTEEETS